jgi:hypothetical protein
LKLFLDNNESDAILTPLRAVFIRHEFRSAGEEGLADFDDLSLFPVLASRKFSAIITRDLNQLRDPNERAGLRKAGLHWIGHRAPAAEGELAIALTAAAYLAALPFFFDRAESLTSPHSFRVQGVGSLAAQRVKVNEVRP